MKTKKTLEIWEHDFIERYGTEKVSLFKNMLNNPTISLYIIAKEFNVSREAVRQWAKYYNITGKDRIKSRKRKKLLDLPFKTDMISLFNTRCIEHNLQVEPILYKNPSGKECVSVKAVMVNGFKCLPKSLINPTTTGGPKQYFRVVFPTEKFDFLCLLSNEVTYILPYEKMIKKSKHPVMLYIPSNQVTSWSNIEWDKYKEAWQLLVKE